MVKFARTFIETSLSGISEENTEIYKVCKSVKKLIHFYNFNLIQLSICLGHLCLGSSPLALFWLLSVVQDLSSFTVGGEWIPQVLSWGRQGLILMMVSKAQMLIICIGKTGTLWERSSSAQRVYFGEQLPRNVKNRFINWPFRFHWGLHS